MASIVGRFADLSVMATNTGSNSFTDVFYSLLSYAKFLHKKDLEDNRDDADNYYRLRLIAISNLIYSFDDGFDGVYPHDLAELEVQVNTLVEFVSDAMNIGELIVMERSRM